MPKIYVFQHIDHEHLGSFENAFVSLGFQPHYFHGPSEDLSKLKINQLSDLGGIVVMGGPMSANDEGRLPFIKEELRLLEEALAKDIPILGICLGSQMLAKVLGAQVYRGEQKEIGWYPLSMRAESSSDPLLKKFPREVTIFQWHGETFDLPRRATLLASSALYPNQAFRFGTQAYGLQFHPEMTLPMVQKWVEEGKDEIMASKVSSSAAGILAEAEQRMKVMLPLAADIVKGFTTLVKCRGTALGLRSRSYFGEGGCRAPTRRKKG